MNYSAIPLTADPPCMKQSRGGCILADANISPERPTTAAGFKEPGRLGACGPL
jgi:hypothetical protein